MAYLHERSRVMAPKPVIVAGKNTRRTKRAAVRTNRPTKLQGRTQVERKKSPGEILRDLVKRSGVSTERIAEIAREKGLAKWSGGNAVTNKWQKQSKYVGENAAPLPWNVVKAIGAAIVGHGTPPVTWAELEALSDAAGGDMGIAVRAASASAGAPREVVASYFANESMQTAEVLPVRYRAEDGVYVSPTVLERSHGLSLLAPSPRYSAKFQFVAVVLDDHAKDIGIPAGAHVQCVSPDSPSHPEPRVGEPALCAIAQDGTGAVRVVFALVLAYQNGVMHVRLPGSSGRIVAKLLGIPIGKYLPI